MYTRRPSMNMPRCSICSRSSWHGNRCFSIPGWGRWWCTATWTARCGTDAYRRPRSSVVAELWLRLHELETDRLWMSTGQARPWEGVVVRLRRPLEAYAGWADRSSSKSRAAARLYLEALERCLLAAAKLVPTNPPPLCFCRSDARFANVIARPDGRIGLVDWEDTGLRDPASEVADLLMHPNQEDLVD